VRSFELDWGAAVSLKLLFLDIDGVLNAREELDPDVNCGTFHRDKVDRLNRVLRKTGAKIVVSSAWRYLINRAEMTIEGFDWLLRSHGVIAGRLHGITRKDTVRDSDHNPRRHPGFLGSERRSSR
jgi:hypothetical protein